MHLRSLALAGGIAWFCMGTAYGGPLVYDNLATPLGGYVGGFKYVEVADDVTLGPGSRTFESLTVAYAGFNFDGDETLTVTLYVMDGAPTAGSFGFNTPGNVLFTETVSISATPGATITFSDSSGIILPEVVGVGLAFGGVDFSPTGLGSDAGPLLYHPPVVGSSHEDYWLRGFPTPSDEWALYTFGGNPPINLGLQITVTGVTVPEPMPIGLFVIGAAVFACRRFWRQARRPRRDHDFR